MLYYWQVISLKNREYIDDNILKKKHNRIDNSVFPEK